MKPRGTQPLTHTLSPKRADCSLPFSTSRAPPRCLPACPARPRSQGRAHCARARHGPTPTSKRSRLLVRHEPHPAVLHLQVGEAGCPCTAACCVAECSAWPPRCWCAGMPAQGLQRAALEPRTRQTTKTRGAPCRSLPNEADSGSGAARCDQNGAGPSYRQQAAGASRSNGHQRHGAAPDVDSDGLKVVRVMEMCAGVCESRRGTHALRSWCLAHFLQALRGGWCTSFACCACARAGVGGLSFLCQKGHGYNLQPTWAVDIVSRSLLFCPSCLCRVATDVLIHILLVLRRMMQRLRATSATTRTRT